MCVCVCVLYLVPCACVVHVMCTCFASWVRGGHTICKVLLVLRMIRVSGFLHSLMDEGVFTLSDYKEVGCLVTVQCCQLDVDNHMTIM